MSAFNGAHVRSIGTNGAHDALIIVGEGGIGEFACRAECAVCRADEICIAAIRAFQTIITTIVGSVAT
jgi:hypothetical protein